MHLLNLAKQPTAFWDHLALEAVFLRTFCILHFAAVHSTFYISPHILHSTFRSTFYILHLAVHSTFRSTFYILHLAVHSTFRSTFRQSVLLLSDHLIQSWVSSQTILMTVQYAVCIYSTCTIMYCVSRALSLTIFNTSYYRNIFR